METFGDLPYADKRESMIARQGKTLEEIMQGDYWQGRDTPETRKMAESVLKRRKTEIRKRVQKKAPLFATSLLEQEFAQMPSIDDLLERRRRVAASTTTLFEQRERDEAKQITRYQAFIREVMDDDYLQECIAREEGWKSSLFNYWYGCYHRAWLRREKPIGEREQKLLSYIVEWPDIDFSACELFDCIYQVEGDGVFQGVREVRDSLNELAARAYIGLSGGRESKAIEMWVIAWRIEYLDRPGVVQEVED